MLDNELLAGNELSLAMLEIDATFFASDVDRKQAVRPGSRLGARGSREPAYHEFLALQALEFL